MANEISANVSLHASEGYLVVNISESFYDDLTIAGMGGAVQKIGTSEEAISFGDVAYPGWCVLKNVDATNYIDIGPDSTGMVNALRLYPGKAMMLYMYPSASWKAKANTAEARLWVRCFEAGTGT
jgi:hypothetical protein